MRTFVALFLVALFLITLTLPDWLEELMNKTAETIEKIVDFAKKLSELLLKLFELASVLEEEKGGSGNYTGQT